MSEREIARTAHTFPRPEIGAEVHLDKQCLLGGAFARELRQLPERRRVLVFPEGHFTKAEQIGFTAACTTCPAT